MPSNTPARTEPPRALVRQSDACCKDYCEAVRRTAEAAAAWGAVLVEIKAGLGHGNWISWFERRYRLSVDTAERYMTLARRWDEIKDRLDADQPLSMNRALTYIKRLDAPKADEEPPQAAQLLATLKSVRPGLSPRENFEQATCFVFVKGWVYTFNDELSCRAPSPFGLEITGVVNASKLLDVLKAWGDGPLDASVEGFRLVLSGGRDGQTVQLLCESEIVLPYRTVERPKRDSWRPLPPEFAEAVATVGECARSSFKRADPRTVAVHVHPEFVEASDTYRMCRWPTETGFLTPTLLHKKNLHHLQNVAPTESAETQNWVHFRNEDGLELSCRRWADVGDYPDLGPSLEVEGRPITFPSELEADVKLAGLLSKDDQQENDKVLVHLQVRDGWLRVTGGSKWTDYVGPWRETAYTGPDAEFGLRPSFLVDVLRPPITWVFGKDGKRLRLKGTAGGATWVYCLTHSEQARRVAEAVAAATEVSRPDPEDEDDEAETTGDR
jgi:hypothetical protein